VGLVAVGCLPSNMFAVVIVLVFITGGGVALTDGPLMAVLQKTIAPEMQGRVFMLFGSLVMLTSPIGLIIAGPVSDAVGIQVWYIAAGLAVIGFALWAACTPAIVNIEDYVYQPLEAEEKLLTGQPAPLPQ
jgi:DHA3 family macrolide efflux protein-like MFS transporter